MIWKDLVMVTANFVVVIGLGLLLTGCATPREPVPDSTMTPEQIRELVCKDGDSKIGGKSINIEINSFPCVAMKTRIAIEDSQGRGFWAGTVTRGFLRTRLVARGIFSTVFGLVGLG